MKTERLNRDTDTPSPVKPLPCRPFLASTEVARTIVRAMRELMVNCILKVVV